MITKKLVVQNGEYICDIDISVEEWKQILQDEVLMKNSYTDVLLKFYAETEYKSTCKALGIKYGLSPQFFNSAITNFSEAVQKKLNRFKVIRENDKQVFWIIPMLGKKAGDHFEWTLRPELVQAITELNLLEVMSVTEYLKFKKLLEYFVSHLEWMNTKDTLNRGYANYIEPLIKSNNFMQTGQGHKNDRIQNQIQKLDHYQSGKICINIQFNPSSKNYRTNSNYLNWEPTGINVTANWKNGKNIDSLSQNIYYSKHERKDLNIDKDLDALGLFDNKETVTEDLKEFFDNYCEQKRIYDLQESKKGSMQKNQPYINLLEANKNLILTGAPGTGKTYLAKQIAERLTGESADSESIQFVQFHPSYDYTDFVEGLRPFKKEGTEIGFELKDGLFKSFCKKALRNLNDSKKDEEQLGKEEMVYKNISAFIENAIAEGTVFKLISGNTFTISGDDNDQISVLVPNNAQTSGLKISKEELSSLLLKEQKLEMVKDVKDVLKHTYNRQIDSYLYTLHNDDNLEKTLEGNQSIKKVEKKNFVLIIDEINRAEISKVFGELFFSIDPGYPGKNGKVKTQYANLQTEDDVFRDGFYVPENVYIIGTMNDIDRSVESMDSAMRRRFAWKEISAVDRISMWDDNIDDHKKEAEKRMRNLNEAIEKTPGLNVAYHIGPAYFLKLEMYQNENDPFAFLWENHIKGVIFEYLRGLPNSQKLLNDLKNAYNNIDDVKNP